MNADVSSGGRWCSSGLVICLARRVLYCAAYYYNKSLSEMPVVCENRCSLQARIDKAIVDTVLGFVELAKMDGGNS